MATPLAHQSTGRPEVSHILAPTDFSSPARRAYTYAIRLAQALSAELVILHVVKAAPGLEGQSSGVRRSLDHEKSHALPELGRMAGLAQDAGVRVEHRLVVGIPDLSILDVAKETGAGMIVMGTHGRTGWDRLQFGSTAVSIVQKASCPVLTVHAAIVGDLPMTPRRLPLARFLVATDFQADAQAALHCATVLATALGGTILLVHAGDIGGAPGPEHNPVTAPSRLVAQQQLEQALAELKERGIGANAIFTSGHTTEVVLKEAEKLEADIIVMGTRRSAVLRRLALGSVAESSFEGPAVPY